MSRRVHPRRITADDRPARLGQFAPRRTSYRRPPCRRSPRTSHRERPAPHLDLWTPRRKVSPAARRGTACCAPASRRPIRWQGAEHIQNRRRVPQVKKTRRIEHIAERQNRETFPTKLLHRPLRRTNQHPGIQQRRHRLRPQPANLLQLRAARRKHIARPAEPLAQSAERHRPDPGHVRKGNPECDVVCHNSIYRHKHSTT